MKAGNDGNAAPEHPRFECRFVERRAASRPASKALDQTLDTQNDQLAEFVLADEIQGPCRLEPHLVERGTTRHQIDGAILTAEAGVIHLAGYAGIADRGLK